MCTEPIRRLIQQCPIKASESAVERATSDLTRDVEEFDNIMEKVLQTCFFALSSTADLPSKLTLYNKLAFLIHHN